MNILVIAEFWDASAGIGSLRPMKIAKYLLKLGHNVTVICGSEVALLEAPCKDLLNLRKQDGYIEIPVFRYSGLYKFEDSWYKRRNASRDQMMQNQTTKPNKAAPEQKKKKIPLWKRFIWFIYAHVYRELKSVNSANNAYKAVKHTIKKPDIIISSFAPVQVHLLARKFKRQYPKAIWIADFRDKIPNAIYQPRIIYKYKEWQQKRLSAKADIVTIISNTLRDELTNIGIKNVYAVFSGYDLDDVEYFENRTNNNKKLSFVYAGSLYPDLSDLKPFFKALTVLIECGKIDAKKLKIEYAGAHPDEFDKQTLILNKQVECINYGLIERKSALKLQCECDILLHASFNFKNTQGIITGKLGEYWLAQKPIVTIINGTIPNAELKDMIFESSTGFAYETISEDKYFLEMCDYICMQYNEKTQKGKVMYEQNKEYVDEFNYENIAKRLVKLAQDYSSNGKRYYVLRLR